MQSLVKLVPDFLKPVLRPIYQVIVGSLLYRKLKSALIGQGTKEELHSYWRHPWDGVNLPQDYLEGEERSKFLVNLVKQYCNSSQSILEIGCNVGRNLNHLFAAGFERLGGVEISEDAVRLLKQVYPEMAGHAQIVNAPAEEALPKFEDDAFDVVFTMAVLQHIHPESGSIFGEMARIGKNFIITIENEKMPDWRNFPRNYRKVFEPLGFNQIYQYGCNKVPGLGSCYVARVFKRR